MALHFLLFTQLFSTLPMLGLIWFVQVVHYPLFALVEQKGFHAYTTVHATRTTWVVAPLMLLELLSAGALLLPALRPVFISGREAWSGAVLVSLIWISTALLQVPLHNAMQREYSLANISRLVASNWVRTIAWTLRAALVLLWVSRLPSA